MGWRIAGIVVALWAFKVAMHQPWFAVCIGLLAGWLFGRGRQADVPSPRPASAQPQRASQVTTKQASTSAQARVQVQPPPPRTPVAIADTPVIQVPPAVAARPTASPQTGPGPETEAVRRDRQAGKTPAARAPRAAQAPPAIHTRTTSSPSGVELSDPYSGKERRWARAEQLRLLGLYEERNSIRDIARIVGIDQKQVAIKLIRLLLAPSGDIENSDGCIRHGMHYSEEELRVMEKLLVDGMRLRIISNEVQRTQLGVGWRLLDMHLPRVPADLRGSLRSDI